MGGIGVPGGVRAGCAAFRHDPVRQRAARAAGGRSVSPSFATLRRYAEAPGTRLTVGLERING